jgi:hypothetical protein
MLGSMLESIRMIWWDAKGITLLVRFQTVGQNRDAGMGCMTSVLGCPVKRLVSMNEVTRQRYDNWSRSRQVGCVGIYGHCIGAVINPLQR